MEEQQKSKDDAAEAERRIAEYCQRFEKGLDNLDIEGKKATLGAFGVRVEVTPEELSITITADPAATTMSPVSKRTAPQLVAVLGQLYQDAAGRRRVQETDIAAH